MDYDFRSTEKKWQKYWADHHTFKTPEDPDKPKYYVLDMFPYPSGAGLHVGHPLGYIATDIVARYKRHKGFNVLHPMGYDSFGLPAEQYAIQTGQHPAVTTEQNIARYREQMDKIGFSFDWDREVRTSDPEFYKWTQWIFIQLFNSWYNKSSDKAEHIETLIKTFTKTGNGDVNAACDEDTPIFTADEWNKFSEREKSDMLMHYRIAYLGEAYVNWCPALGTVLANDEVKDGVSERGGYPVERKLMRQWSMRITAYTQRLLDGLEKIDWPESLKESQRYWIGRSEGGTVSFGLTPLPPLPGRGGLGSEGRGGEADSDLNKKYHWQTASPELYGLLKLYARENRKPLTEAEDILWQSIRNRKLEAKFRRQHAIGPYIADFVSIEHNLIIEVDGEIHQFQKEKDDARVRALNDLGFEVIRFRNEEIEKELDNVLEKIRAKLLKIESERPADEEIKIEVFTTRPDTIFGVSFIVLAPEHELVEKITVPEQKKAVEEYVNLAKNRSERERQANVDKVSGVFTGTYALHPFTGKKIPIWIGDYVLAGYGTGAVMAVPGHDSRDHAFAKHFGLDIPEVVAGGDLKKEAYEAKEGKLINSDFLNGLDVKDAIRRAIDEIEKKGIGESRVNYRLRDAVFGRQRYWGEPIPIYYKDGVPYAVKEEHLPIHLPDVDKFLPTESGEPPLARAIDWTYSEERGEMLGSKLGIVDGHPFETTTMPGWAGSSWYFLRYMDPHNKKEFAGKKALDYWKNVDLYIGGSEHATGHLLYVRFWTKFLFDMGLIGIDEPAEKLINQGMIQGTSALIHRINGGSKIISAGLKSKYETSPIHVDVNFVENNHVNIDALKKWRDDFKDAEFELENGNLIATSTVEKMSKRWYNVVTPDSICEKFGADTLRLYEMFLGPLEQSKPWNTNGITGVSGFIRKLWRLYHKDGKFSVSDAGPVKSEMKILHRTIKKIEEDIERFSFNTSVSSFMICVNELSEIGCDKRAVLEPLLILISPYAPHIAEELWEKLGHKESICYAPFPVFQEKYVTEDSFSYPVSFNGKVRFNIELPLDFTPQQIESEVMSREEVKYQLKGASPKKVIVVPKRIVNIVV